MASGMNYHLHQIGEGTSKGVVVVVLKHVVSSKPTIDEQHDASLYATWANSQMSVGRDNSAQGVEDPTPMM